MSLSASTLSGSTITSSRYQTRRALLPLGQGPFSDTPRADCVYLVGENLIRCVISPSSDHWSNDTDGSSVFVLFVLVRSSLFRDGTSGTKGNEEQVLAGVVPNVDVRRWVSTPLDPQFSTTPKQRFFIPHTQSKCVIHNVAFRNIAHVSH